MLVWAAFAGPLSAVPTTAALPAKANLASSHLAVDASGAVGVLYVSGGSIVVWRSTDRSQEVVPVPRGAVVDGFVFSQGQPMVLTQASPSCGDLSILVRDQTGLWTTEPVLGRGRTATMTTDPTGSPVVLSSGCDGALEVRTRSGPARWTVEQTGVRTLPFGRVSLAVGAGGVIVCGVAGEQAAIVTRSSTGTWTRLTLPGPGALAPGETVSTLRVALDPSLRPVSFIVRGPGRRPIRSEARAPVLRLASRFDGAIWTQIATVPNAVSLVGTGSALAILDRSGTIAVESAGFTGPVAGPSLRFAIGADGLLARVQGRPLSPQLLVGV
jgi:hypothetical protein